MRIIAILAAAAAFLTLAGTASAKLVPTPTNPAGCNMTVKSPVRVTASPNPGGLVATIRGTYIIDCTYVVSQASIIDAFLLSSSGNTKVATWTQSAVAHVERNHSLYCYGTQALRNYTGSIDQGIYTYKSKTYTAPGVMSSTMGYQCKPEYKTTLP